MISNKRLSGCFVVLVLCLTFSTESRGSVEETKAFEGKLADIARLDTIRRRRSESDYKPREKSHQEKCVENAVRLALRNPDSELSHAVYANIVEERVAESQYNELFQQVLKARQKSSTNELNRCRKRLREQEDYCEKLSEKLWQRDILPLVSKVILNQPDCGVHVPANVVKDQSVGSAENGYDIYDASKGHLTFKGIEIGASTSTCDVVSTFVERKWVTCRPKEHILGLETCTVSYDANGCILGIHFMLNPSTKFEYDKIIDNVVSEVRSFVGYRNQTFLYSDESDAISVGASFTLNIFKDYRRYIIRIDQSHLVFENRLMHFIALRVMFGNEISHDWSPPKGGIHIGSRESDTGSTSKDGARKEKTEEEKPFAMEKAKAESRPLWIAVGDFEPFPSFGRGIAYIDEDTGEEFIENNRTLESRLHDYFHPCVKREPFRTVGNQDIQRWIDNRIKKRDMKRYNKPIQHQYKVRLLSIELNASYVASEYYCYKIDSDFSGIIKAINKFYSQDYNRRWEDLARFDKQCREFDRMMNSIEDEIHSKLNVLDVVHRREFESWKRENPTEYASIKKRVDDANHKLKMEANVNNARREISAARREAELAKDAARAAEERAASAEDAAAAAAYETWGLRERLKRLPPIR